MVSRRTVLGLLASASVVAMSGTALAKQEHHKSGHQLIGAKLKQNGKHQIDKAGNATVTAEVNNGKVVGMTATDQLLQKHVGEDFPGVYVTRKPRVTFAGPQQDPKRYFGAADVFVLPTLYDPLPNAVLEAMACAKPAVGCTGQGIEEIIRDGENGRLVPPNDEDALTEALLLLLRDANLRKRLGRAARETVVRSHRVQNQAQELARLYKECLA